MTKFDNLAGICPLPWMHFSVNTDTTLRVCCNTDHGGVIRSESGDPIRLRDTSSLYEAMNQKTLRDLRLAMARGERPEFCNRCYKHEDFGGVSVRQLYLEKYQNALELDFAQMSLEGVITPRIRYLDFSLSNSCNLKCRMCTPQASYLLQKEYSDLGFPHASESVTDARDGWDFEGNLEHIFAEAIPSLEQILTTGGEPFLSKTHLRMLELCVSKGRSHEISLMYHSNLTVLPSQLVELWEKFKHVDVHVSLEGVGATNEFMRYPSKWDSVVANIEKLLALRETISIGIEWHTCLQAMTWLKMDELMEFTFNLGSRWGGGLPRIPSPIWVDTPEPMSLLALPPELRELGSARILRFLDKNESHYLKGPNPGFEMAAADSYRASIMRLKESTYNPSLFAQLVERTRRVDRYRNQDFLKLMPEFQPHFDRVPASQFS